VTTREVRAVVGDIMANADYTMTGVAVGEHLLQSKLPMSKLPSEKEALWRAQRELREEAAGNYDTAFEHLDRYGKEYMRLNEGSHAWTTVDKDGSFESFFISFKVRASEASAKERARKQNTESSGQRLHLGCN